MGSHAESRGESALSGCQTITMAANVLLFAFLFGAQGCGSSGGSLPPPAPTFTTIDAPGAGTTMGLGTFVQDINAEGDIVGYFKKTPFDLGHVFVRTAAGVLTVLDVPGQGTLNGQGATAQRINSADTIVGYFADSQSALHGFIRTVDGTFTLFDAPGAKATFTAGINDAGTVAGQFEDNNLVLHGYLRARDGSFTVFDGPDGGTSSVAAINSGGTVIGLDSASDGFLRNPDGTSTIFDPPTGAIGCGPDLVTACLVGTGVADINTSGAIVGTDYATVGTESFLRTPAGSFQLFIPSGASNAGSSATGINDSGTVVGNYIDANGIMHGYLRKSDGTLITIDDPNVVPGANSGGTSVTHINVNGAIVGFYVDSQGARHGFLRE